MFTQNCFKSCCCCCWRSRILKAVAIIDAVVSKIFKLLLLLPSLLLFLEENDLESFIFFFCWGFKKCSLRNSLLLRLLLLLCKQNLFMWRLFIPIICHKVITNKVYNKCFLFKWKELLLFFNFKVLKNRQNRSGRKKEAKQIWTYYRIVLWKLLVKLIISDFLSIIKNQNRVKIGLSLDLIRQFWN